MTEEEAQVRREAEKRKKEEEIARIKQEDAEAIRLASQKKIDANAAQVQEAELQLSAEADKTRLAELTQAAQSQQQVVPPDWAAKYLEAIARGEDPWKLGLPRPRESISGPNARTPQDLAVEKQLQAIASGAPSGSLTAPQSATAPSLQVSSPPSTALSAPASPTVQVAPAIQGPLTPKWLEPYRPEPRSVQQVEVGPQSIAVAPLPPPTPEATAMVEPPSAPAVAAQLIDKENAVHALAYALLSRDAYNESGTGAVGYRRAGDWEAILRKTGALSNDEIVQLAKSGFSASIFVKGTSASGRQEVVVAFRGTHITSAVDWSSNVGAQVGEPGSTIIPRQYAAAADIIEQVQLVFPKAAIVATGHSLGGGLASYAGNKTGVAVWTFNAARNEYSSVGKGGNQVNIIASGDIVGDPSKSSLVGTGQLPGQTYFAESSSGPGLLEQHGIDGLIGALSDAARK